MDVHIRMQRLHCTTDPILDEKGQGIHSAWSKTLQHQIFPLIQYWMQWARASTLP